MISAFLALPNNSLLTDRVSENARLFPKIPKATWMCQQRATATALPVGPSPQGPPEGTQPFAAALRARPRSEPWRGRRRKGKRKEEENEEAEEEEEEENEKQE